MKKIFMFLLAFISCLFSEDKTSTIFLEFEYSGKTEVFIDCNYNNKGFIYNYKKFSNDVALNDTFKEYCKNGEDFKIDSLENFRKMYKQNTSGRRTTDIYPNKQYLEIKNGEVFNNEFLNKYLNSFVLSINSFNHSSGVFSLNIIPIVSIENVRIGNQTYLGTLPLNKKQFKDYKFNNLVFDTKTKLFKPYTLSEDVIFKSEIYTNNYKIDDNNLCVNGYIEKDKSKTNLYCPYIVKPLPPVVVEEIKKEKTKEVKKQVKKDNKKDKDNKEINKN